MRQGNENPEVQIITYVTEGTFDAYLYQMVERKQRFIGQIMTSKSPVRSAEDIDEQALSYAEIKALSSGDERIKEKMDLEVDVAKLRLYKSDYLAGRYALEDKIRRKLPKEIQNCEVKIAGYQADIALVRQSKKDDTGFYGPMVIAGQPYADKKSAGKALLTFVAKAQSLGSSTFGTYRGFTLKAELGEFGMTVLLCGALQHRVSMSTDVLGNIQRLDNALAKMPGYLENAEHRLESYRQQLETAKAEVQKPFPQEEELAQKEARLAQLNIELDLDHPSAEVLEEDAPTMRAPVRARTEVSR